MTIHKYKTKDYKFCIRWIKYNIEKEELKNKTEEEINEYIYNRLKNKNNNYAIFFIFRIPFKRWLKNNTFFEIAYLLGYFGGNDHFKELGLNYE